MKAKAVVKLFFNGVLRILPWEWHDKVRFFMAFGRFPNVDPPKTLNEHVLLRKWSDCWTDELYSTLADKLAVRSYIEQKIGGEYLIELIRVVDDPEDLVAILPGLGAVVIKPNHGAGMVKVVGAPLTLDEISALVSTARRWLRVDFSKVAREAHYRRISPVLLIERRIGSGSGALRDYKFHVFKRRGGDSRFVLQIIDERFSGDLERTFYIDQFELPYSGDVIIGELERSLLSTARLLSLRLLGDLPYARVDWYIDDGKLYFGEITLTPASGLGRGYGAELDELMGEMWTASIQLGVRPVSSPSSEI